jgi:hypothetical protein
MMPRTILPILLLAWGCASEEKPPAAASARVRAELSTLTLSKLLRKECRVTEKDGTVSVYEGVALGDVLSLMGVTIGVHPKGRHPIEIVFVEAMDGYRAVFSKAEVDPAFTESTVLLADRVDGRPLAPGDGPWRLIVPSDKIRSRWVKQVRTIEVSSPN